MRLRPPEFDDPLDNRTALLLSWMLWACMLGGLAFVGGLLVIDGDLPQGESAGAIIAITGFGMALALLYSGRLSWAAGVATLGLLVAAITETARLGGPSGYLPLLPHSLLALGLGGVVLRWPQIVLLTGIQVVLVGVLYWAELQGMLPVIDHAVLHNRMGIYSMALLMVAGVFLAGASWVFRRTFEEGVASEDRYRDLVDHLPDGVLTYDAAGNVTSCNPAAAAILGTTPETMLGMHFTEVVQHDDDAALMQGFRAVFDRLVEPELARTPIRRTDGTDAVVESNPVVVERGGRTELRVVIRDVTAQVREEQQRAELEHQLREARRLESVGRLAGGVAHDFNNLLTVILSSASLMKSEALPQDARSLLADVDKATQRAAELTRQLLTFARGQVREPRAIDLIAVIGDAERLLRRLARDDIELRVDLAPTPVPVFADPVQIEQVLVNLMVNARDAMPTGGMIHVRCGIDEETQSARLCVADTGDGMDPDTLAHAFEPFYSTKGSKGTGLGLATVYGIVTQSGGTVEVRSEVGQGTELEVRFPLTDRPLEADPTDERDAATGSDATVLVVDDDAAVLRITCRILTDAGYAVLAADGADQALAQSRAHDGPIALVLTDVVMPGTGGVELGRLLGSERPALKTLYMSGYTGDANLQLDTLELLPKPFTPAELLERVAAVLEPDEGPRDP